MNDTAIKNVYGLSYLIHTKIVSHLDSDSFKLIIGESSREFNCISLEIRWLYNKQAHRYTCSYTEEELQQIYFIKTLADYFCDQVIEYIKCQKN